MPRPRKCRRVRCLPEYDEFGPYRQNSDDMKEIVLTIDEFETIRLIDKFDLNQVECSAYMNVARTTVQQIYTSARKKIALALVEGAKLKIEGGDYELCDMDNRSHCECHGHNCHCECKEGE